MLLLFLGRMPETEGEKIYRLLNSIPKDKWITGVYTNGIDKCCFVGHYTRLTSNNPKDFRMANCETDNPQVVTMRRLVRKFLYDKQFSLYPYRGPTDVNDTLLVNGYTEDNPKDRVMHLLQDMIKAGY